MPPHGTDGAKKARRLHAARYTLPDIFIVVRLGYLKMIKPKWDTSFQAQKLLVLALRLLGQTLQGS